MPVLVRLPLSRKTICVECDGHGVPVEEIRREVSRHEGIPEEFLALSCGGVLLREVSATDGQWLTCSVTGLPGGKGGFGSMLRAIGAQIEKTTNREACRDLSGRRLRDINHEARLKRWVAKQAERENQHKQRKEYREPEHHLEDPEYERIREQIPERIQDAVAQGLSAGIKRPAASTSGECSSRKRPAAALWLPDVPSDGSSDDDSDSAREDRNESARTDSSGERNASTAEPDATETESSGDGEDQRKPDDVGGTERPAATTEPSHTEEPQPPDTDK
uniref:SDE2-like domain-containing protein n=1 Tax=Rhipicephalus appendiculatus TaxID=34631 RepID=A0A131YSU8_RHIAP